MNHQDRRPALLMLLAIACAFNLPGCSDSSIPSHPVLTSSASVPTPSPSPSPQGTRLSIKVRRHVLPVPLQRSVAVAYKDNILVAGGLDATDNSVDTVYELDPSTGKTRLLGHVATPFHDAAGAMIKGKLMIFGGGQEASSSEVQAFDPIARTSHIVSHLPSALSDVSSAVVGHRVFLVGGYDGVTPQRKIYETTDGVHFRNVGLLPQGVRYAAVTTAGSGLLIAGGGTANGPSRRVKAFDPSTGATKNVALLRTAVGHAAAITIGGTLVIVGGRNTDDQAIPSLQVVRDPGSLRLPTRLPAPLSDAAVVAVGGVVYLVGGWDGSGPIPTLTALRSLPVVP